MSSGSQKKRLAFLVSGGGTNMQAVLDAVFSGAVNASAEAVISSRPGVFALERAKAHNIPSYVFPLKDFASAAERDGKILEVLLNRRIDYVILAGYLGIVTRTVLEAFENRIINIHPALLPSYGGKDFFGINVHKAVIENKERYSGATVHFVDDGTDTGPIIAQQKIEVLPGDTPETLQKRILEEVEHKLLVSVVKDLCDGKICIKNGKTVYM